MKRRTNFANVQPERNKFYAATCNKLSDSVNCWIRWGFTQNGFNIFSFLHHHIIESPIFTLCCVVNIESPRSQNSKGFRTYNGCILTLANISKNMTPDILSESSPE